MLRRKGGLKHLALLAVRECAWIMRALTPLRAKPDMVEAGASDWDREYRAGKWDFLGSIPEEAHKAVIATYMDRIKPDGRILDVGCGPGNLSAMLRKFGYKSYLGIDVSPAAIKIAGQYADASTSFRAVSGEMFETSDRFDTIIFNECLNYFADPAATLRGYSRLLAADGIFIVSLSFTSVRNALHKLKIWRDIEAQWHVLDETVIYRRRDATWIVKVLVSSREAGADRPV
jgi:SAM-dependent methyltransferase